MKFAMNGALYRGSKPVMWSVVEKTALAEAEVEYHDYQSDTIWVKFHVVSGARVLEGRERRDLDDHAVDHPGQPRRQLLAEDRVRPVRGDRRARGQLGQGGRHVCAGRQAGGRHHEGGQGGGVRAPRGRFSRRAGKCRAGASVARRVPEGGYDFDVPLLAGDHVTDDTGTGFVHTAPSHGADDYDVWMANEKALAKSGMDTTIPFTVDADGVLTKDAPGFTGKRVLKENGDKGDANDAVIKALSEAQRADLARAAEASVSALVAVEEAGDLSQHAAVVHRHGPADHGAGAQDEKDHPAAGARRPSRRPSFSRPLAATGCMR